MHAAKRSHGTETGAGSSPQGPPGHTVPDNVALENGLGEAAEAGDARVLPVFLAAAREGMQRPCRRVVQSAGRQAAGGGVSGTRHMRHQAWW